MNKAVRLQGNGAGSTFINGNPTPTERLQAWHDRINNPAPAGLNGANFAAFLLKNPFSESEAPAVFVAGQTEFPGGNLQIPDPNPLNNQFFNQGNIFPPTHGQALVDGFKLSGSKAGGGLFAVSGANHLTVSNNNITGNQGNYAGGIAVGTQDSGFDALNTNLIIRYNKIHRNGGVQGGGGISMNEYANNYLIQENLIVGNFSRFNGGGINHRGVSPGENVIRWNKVLFNEDFFGALLARAGDGGGIIIGGDVAGGTGAGNVTIDGNLIQGNLTGSGYGGGIRAFAINGDDIRNSPATPNNWYRLRIFNNIIVNNVAALAGAGISLQDVVFPVIINNTIANNDATATSRLAFTAGSPDSTPRISGIQSGMHSDILMGLSGLIGQPFSNPLLANNLIWGNRSWYNDHTLNGGAGGLAPASTSATLPNFNLGVDLNGGALTAQFCTINSLAGLNPTGANNLTSNPEFVLGYTNTLSSATVLDEGGNNITVRYTPLIPNNGNYHLRSNSPAINTGTNAFTSTYAPLALDFDRQTRPNGANADRGADEFYGGGPVATSYTISGRVRTAALAPVSGVTLTLYQGSVAFRTATTNSLGSYQLTNIPNGFYSLIPTRAGFTFVPPSQDVTVSGANRPGLNFTGAPVAAGARVLRSATPGTNPGTVIGTAPAPGTESPIRRRIKNGKALRLKNQLGGDAAAPLRYKGQDSVPNNK